MPSVIHVIPVVNVVNVNVVGFVPGVRPVFRPRINQTEPEASVLEPWISAHDNYRDGVNAKPVATAKMRAEMAFGNTVASVTATFVPVMMFMLPMLCAMAFPSFSPVLFVFVPVGLTHMFRPMPLLVMWLLVFRSVVVCSLLLVRALIALMLPPIGLVLVRVLHRRAPVVFLVFVIFVLLGITLPSVVVPVL